MRELPQYMRIYEDLRTDITEGVFLPGELLPSEHALCLKYNVARLTVRKSLDLLISDGFIIRRQGKGSIVKGFPKSIGILSLLGTTSAVNNPNLTTQIAVKQELREWTDALSFPLDAREEKVRCIYFERLRFLDEAPVFYDITMLPNIDLPGFLDYDLENKSLFDTLRTQYQIIVTGGVQQIFAIRPDKKLQKFFNIHLGYPVLQLNRKIETNRSGFHIYSQVFCTTRRYGLTGTF